MHSMLLMLCEFTCMVPHTIDVLVDLFLWMPTCLCSSTHSDFNVESAEIPVGSDPLSLFQLRFLRSPQIGEHHSMGYFREWSCTICTTHAGASKQHGWAGAGGSANR